MKYVRVPYVPGTPQAVCTARGGRLEPFSLWQQKEAITKFFLAKKEERDLMDNDSVIDPLQSPNESRCKNLVPRSTSYPFFHPYQQSREPPLISLHFLLVQSSKAPSLSSSSSSSSSPPPPHDGGDPPNARFHAFLLSPLTCGQSSRSVRSRGLLGRPDSSRGICDLEFVCGKTRRRSRSLALFRVD